MIVSNTKHKLSDLLQKVQQGDEVTIVDRNRPVARIVAIKPTDELSGLDRLIEKGIIKPPVAKERALPPLVLLRMPCSRSEKRSGV